VHRDKQAETAAPHEQSAAIVDRKSYFQQDNARPQVATDTMQFLAQTDVTTTQWPAYSPDINPIENALMKNYVRNLEPQNLTELIAAIKKGRRQIVAPNLCKRLYSSMRVRVQAVIWTLGLL
jgi:transposase